LASSEQREVRESRRPGSHFSARTPGAKPAAGCFGRESRSSQCAEPDQCAVDLIEAGRDLPGRFGRLLVELRVGCGFVRAFLFRFRRPDSSGRLLKLPPLIEGKFLYRTNPESGVWSLFVISRRVDFPVPLRPMRPTRSRASIAIQKCKAAETNRNLIQGCQRHHATAP
jgi:hypothetical protein